MRGPDLGTVKVLGDFTSSVPGFTFGPAGLGAFQAPFRRAGVGAGRIHREYVEGLSWPTGARAYWTDANGSGRGTP